MAAQPGADSDDLAHQVQRQRDGQRAPPGAQRPGGGVTRSDGDHDDGGERRRPVR